MLPRSGSILAVEGPHASPQLLEPQREFQKHSEHFYFLNKLSNAARALVGRKLAGVEVSFSRVTRISNSSHKFRSSFFAIRSFTGCMHSNRLPGSK